MVWQDGKSRDNLNIDSLEAANNITSHIKYSTTKYLKELISKNSCLSDATKRLLYKYCWTIPLFMTNTFQVLTYNLYLCIIFRFSLSLFNDGILVTMSISS